MTELLHHSRSTTYLQDLRPETKYEASLVLIPPTRANTELFDTGRVEFTTAPYIGKYTIYYRTLKNYTVYSLEPTPIELRSIFNILSEFELSYVNH